MNKYGEELDWERYMTFCKSKRIERPPVIAIYLAHLIFNTKLPVAVKNLVEKDRTIEEFAVYACSRFHNQTPPPTA